jgi:transcription termination factor Rho
VLDRELADRRIFPAINLLASATRREELLMSNEALRAATVLRRDLSRSSPAEAMTDLLGFMRRTKTNDELIRAILGG